MSVIEPTRALDLPAGVERAAESGASNVAARGRETILHGARSGDAQVRTIVETWAKSVGMSLP